VRFVDLEPQDGGFVREDAVRVRGRVEGPGVAAVLVNSIPAPLADGSRFDLLIEVAPEIDVVAQDRDGQPLALEQRRVLVDRDPPVLTVDGGPELVTREARVVLAGRVQDENPEPVIYVNEVAHRLKDGRFEVERTLRSKEESIVLKARDRAGNEATATVHVVRDVDPPVLKLAASDFVTNADSFLVDATVEDAHPSHVMVDGKRVAIPPGGRCRASVPLALGTNTIEVQAFDLAGNASAPVRIRATRDLRRPELAVAPLPAETTAAQITVEGTADKDDCKIAVNDAPAVVAGRRFSAHVPLSVGPNEIRVVARSRRSARSRA
jgi:hypothetical protein